MEFRARFKRLDELPRELIGEAIAAMPLDEFVARAELAHRR